MVAPPCYIEAHEGTKARTELLPPLARHDHVDLPAGALRTDEPLTPFEDGIFALYRRACSAGSGSTCWLHVLHHTMSRTRAAAALPSVIGGPGSDFIPACRAAYLVATAYRLTSHLWLREGDRVARKRRRVPSRPGGLTRRCVNLLIIGGGLISMSASFSSSVTCMNPK
jgi:hypothetical protein